jgi:hypothetical protein
MRLASAQRNETRVLRADASSDVIGEARAILRRDGGLVKIVGALDPAALVEERPAALVELACRLGVPLGYADEFDGALVHHIRPSGAPAHLQVSSNSCDLRTHTEDAYHDVPSDYLILACVEPGPVQVPTSITTLSRARLRDISDPIAAELSRPQFRFEYCYLTPVRGQYSPAFSVIDGRDHGWHRLRYSELGRVLCATDRARVAIKSFAAILPDSARVCLGAGDLLIINNRRSLHGRQPYQPTFAGSDRHLRRLYVLDEDNPCLRRPEGFIVVDGAIAEAKPVTDTTGLTVVSAHLGETGAPVSVLAEAFDAPLLRRRVAIVP